MPPKQLTSKEGVIISIYKNIHGDNMENKLFSY